MGAGKHAWKKKDEPLAFDVFSMYCCPWSNLMQVGESWMAVFWSLQPWSLYLLNFCGLMGQLALTNEFYLYIQWFTALHMDQHLCFKGSRRWMAFKYPYRQTECAVLGDKDKSLYSRSLVHDPTRVRVTLACICNFHFMWNVYYYVSFKDYGSLWHEALYERTNALIAAREYL